MAYTALSTTQAPPQARRDRRIAEALLDAALLFLVIGTASDMMINLGRTFTAVWLLCYALVLLRILTTWPHFLSMLSRNFVVLAYPVICLASVVWSYSPAGSMGSAVQLTITVLMGCYLGWRYSLPILLKCFAVLMTVAAALSILHMATGIFPWPTHSGSGGLAGLFKHKTMLGQRSLFCITVVTGLLMTRRCEVGWTPRPVLMLSLALTLTTLLLSSSVASILLMPAMVGLVLLLCLHRIPPAIALGGLAAGVLALSLGPIGLTVAGIDPMARLLEEMGKDATLTGRTVLWEIAASTYRDHPLLGTGFRAFWLAPEFTNGRWLTYEAGARHVASFHNFVLEILVSVGLPGIVAMLSLIVVCARRLTRLFLRDRLPLTAAALSILAGIVFTSLLETSLFRGHEIMMVLLVAMTVAAGEDLRRREGPGAGRSAVEEPDV